MDAETKGWFRRYFGIGRSSTKAPKPPEPELTRAERRESRILGFALLAVLVVTVGVSVWNRVDGAVLWPIIVGVGLMIAIPIATLFFVARAREVPATQVQREAWQAQRADVKAFLERRRAWVRNVFPWAQKLP